MSNLPQHLFQYVNELAKDEAMSEIKIETEVRPFTGDNFLGEIIRVQLVGKCQGKKKTLNLIIKKSPESAETRKQMKVKDYYRNEIFTYEKILPAFNELQEKYELQKENRFTFAKVYKHSFQELKELIIMEDLSLDGFTMWERRKSLDNDHMIQIMKELARLHALSFVMNDENPKLFKTLIDSIPKSENYGEFMAAITESSMELVIPKLSKEEFKKQANEFRGNVRQVYRKCLDAKETEPYNVICHGDAFRNNFLFKYENGRVIKMTLIDWQLVRYASPVTDLSYVICLSTDKTTRNTHFTSWIHEYFESLSFNMLKMGHEVNQFYPREIFMKHLRELFHYSLVFSFLSIPYTMKKPGDENSVDQISEKLKKGDLDVEISDEVIDRLEGLLTDCNKFGFI